MATIDKAAIQALIDSYNAKILLYITSNNNKDITGAQLKEILDESSAILKDIKDSYFNLINEPRTATSTTYDNVISGLLATNAQAAIDELSLKTSTNPSQNIAHVATNGSDTEYEIGNSLKPFKTFTKAFAEMPTSNFIVYSLGGVFSEDFDVDGKSNFILNLNGTTINTSGNGVRLINGCNKGMLYLNSGTINGTVNLAGGSSQISCFDGYINGRLFVADKAFVSNVEILSTSSNAIDSAATTSENRPFISTCRIVSTSNEAVRKLVNCSNCYIEGNKQVIRSSSAANENAVSKFTNCTIIGKGSTGPATDNVISGDNGVLNGIFKKCYIKSTVGSCVFIGNTTSSYVFFDDCIINSKTDCVILQGVLERQATIRSTFTSCEFYTDLTGIGEIFKYNGVTNGLDLGKTQILGATTVNKALLPIGTPAPANLENFEVFGTLDVVADAQTPPL